MGDNPPLELENGGREHLENEDEALIPHLQQNVVEEGQVAEQPPRLVNVREVILQPLPPINGIVRIPNRPVDHQQVLLNLGQHLGRYANLANLLARNNQPPMQMGEIRDLLDAIDIVDEEERAEVNEERPMVNGAPPAEKHDDSDGSSSSDDSNSSDESESEETGSNGEEPGSNGEEPGSDGEEPGSDCEGPGSSGSEETSSDSNSKEPGPQAMPVGPIENHVEEETWD